MMTATQVFGERAGRFAARRSKKLRGKRIPEMPAPQYLERVELKGTGETEPFSDIERELTYAMTRYVSILRSQEGLIKCRRKVEDLEKRLDSLDSVQKVSSPRRFRLRNMIRVAQLVVEAAISRRQSLGSHYRED